MRRDVRQKPRHTVEWLRNELPRPHADSLAETGPGFPSINVCFPAGWGKGDGPLGLAASMTDRASLVEALSLERFGRYLTWAADDQAKALGLYTLNTRLSEALYVPLQVLEVALRNRVHTVLAGVHGPRWFEVAGLLQVPNQETQITDAIDDLRRQGKDPLPGRVVAALTFSFWTAMLGKPYENLWQTDLHRIARREDGKGLQRKDFARSLTPIRLLRNRIAHHEPIVGWDLPKHHDAMLRLTGWLSPAAADWCRGLDRFDTIYPVEPLSLAGGE